MTAKDLYTGHAVNLMMRTNHTMVTFPVRSSFNSMGLEVTEFESLIFGGMIRNEFGQLTTNNDLIAVRTTAITDKHKGPRHIELNATDLEHKDLAQFQLLQPSDQRAPLPRRDHSAQLINNNKQMVVFGGRNDQDLQMREFNDLLIYDIEQNRWTAIAQTGFAPGPRWGAALFVHEARKKMFVFGGSSYAEGICSAQVFCFDYCPSNVNEKRAELRKVQEEALSLNKKFLTAFERELVKKG